MPKKIYYPSKIAGKKILIFKKLQKYLYILDHKVIEIVHVNNKFCGPYIVMEMILVRFKKLQNSRWKKLRIRKMVPLKNSYKSGRVRNNYINIITILQK